MSEDKLLLEIGRLFDEKFEQTENRLNEKLDKRFEQTENYLNKRLELIENHLDEKLKLTEINFDKRLEQTEKQINDRFDRSDQNILLLDRRLRSVELTIENEVNKKISFVAEGHLDLSRKLDEAMRIEQEKEMLSLRLVSMEGEIRRIKEKIS